MSQVEQKEAPHDPPAMRRWPYLWDDDPNVQAAVAFWSKRDGVTARELAPHAFPNCEACPFSKNGGPHRPVAGEGPPDPKWIIVGEGPGAVEQMEGRPFVGPSGRMVMRILKAVNVEREAVWITNSTLCMPRGKTEAELEQARVCCAPRLKHELSRFPKRPILALGSVASKALLGGHFSISELASSLHDVDVDGTGDRPVIATHHPARILRGGDGDSNSEKSVDLLFWTLVYDAGKINALAEGKAVRFSDDIFIEATNHRRAEQLFQRIYNDVMKTRHCAIDVETDGLDALRVQLTAIAVATKNFAVSVAIDVFTPRIWSMLERICKHKQVAKTFHNRPYDAQVLARYDVHLDGPLHDTLLKHHAAFPGASHRLQHVATQFFAIRPWKAEFRRGLDENGRSATIEDLLQYNARDTLVTARLDPILDGCMAQTGGERCYEVDNALVSTVIKMQARGLPVDLRRSAELRVHFQRVIDRTRAAIEGKAADPVIRDKFIDKLALIRALTCRKTDPLDFLERHQLRKDELTYGRKLKKPTPWRWACACGAHGECGFHPDAEPTECADCGREAIEVWPARVYLKDKGPIEFSIGNPDHIAAYLKACGHNLYRITKGGKPSTAKDVLEELTNIADVRTILEFRESDKCQNTFVVNLPLRTERVDWLSAMDRRRLKMLHRLRVDAWFFVWLYMQGVEANVGPKRLEALYYTYEKNRAAVADAWMSWGYPEWDSFFASPWWALGFEMYENTALTHNGKWLVARWAQLHPSWDLHKITGRWGSSPNVQNWPKENMRGRPNLRSQVIARRGRKFVGADYAQLEARIIGAYSGDPFLYAIFMENYGQCGNGCRPDAEPTKFCPMHDIHTVFALEVFGQGFLQYSKSEKKELRDLTKRGEYGGFYKGAPETLYKSIVKEFPHVTLADVTKILTIIASKMMHVGKWHEALAHEAMTTGQVREAILGRRRAFPLGNFEESVLVNFPVQTMGASIIDLGILKLEARLKAEGLDQDCFLIVQGHDSVVLDVPEELADHVALLTTECLSMTVTVGNTAMFFPANADVDTTWAGL